MAAPAGTHECPDGAGTKIYDTCTARLTSKRNFVYSLRYLARSPLVSPSRREALAQMGTISV